MNPQEPAPHVDYNDISDEELLDRYCGAWLVVKEGWYTMNNEDAWYTIRDNHKAELLRRMKGENA